MRFDILTLFPAMVKGPLQESVLHKASQKGLLEFFIHDLRSFTHDKHHITDDVSYGGGPGMVMKPEPIFEAVRSLVGAPKSPRIILMTPAGRPFSHTLAHELSREDRLIFICGHYEGVDERVREQLVTDEISIGDYVLTGGELPALVVMDAVARLVPGVVGDPDSVAQDSFENGLLDFPHYTRPDTFEAMEIPEVLKSGHHGEIAVWRRQQALKRTVLRRPDLLQNVSLTDADQKYLQDVLAGNG